MIILKKKCLFIFILLLILSTSVHAEFNCGPWAEDAINVAVTCGILKDNVSRDYFAPITRIEIANLISSAYDNISDDKIEFNVSNFTDTSDEAAYVVSALGIMNGYGDGTFMPDAFTSRQEMAKIILTYKSVITDSPLVLPETYDCTFTDFETLSSWAKPYVQKANSDGLLNGYVDGSFGGMNTVSWQEAVVLVERVANFVPVTEKDMLLDESFNLKANIEDSTLKVSWTAISENDTHLLTITEQRLSRYEEDIPPNTPITLYPDSETDFSFEINPNKKYTITISCGDKYFTETIYSEKLIFDDMKEIYSSYPATQEEAELLMSEITVPIWQLSDNEKIASEATLTVHNAIAEKVILIFQEIFNGEEKFPIKDIGGYSWRGGTTEHNGGTAIDINYDENYCIYNDGTTVGSHWKPYEDPYSITPYGDVIRAFEKYGFTWGGDSWSNPKDYMHFSYLGK